MLSQNKLKADILGITHWHEQGYTGKGIKIGMFDSDFNVDKPFFDGMVKVMPGLNRGKAPEWEHGTHTADIIHQIAPDAEIFLLAQQFPTHPDYSEVMDWCVANKIFLINKSMYGFASDYDIAVEKRAKERGVTLMVSAGNRGLNGLGASAKTDNWYSVGACDIVDGQIQRIVSSSIGEQLDTCTLTNWYCHGGNPTYFPIFGQTSCACAVTTGMLALWFQMTKSIMGRYPKPSEVEAFIKDNSKDLQEPGWDKYTGYGLFTLPKPEEKPAPVRTIKFTVGSHLMYESNEVNPKYMDTVPIIRDSRMLIPVRFLAEAFGLKVEWDSKTQTATFSK